MYGTTDLPTQPTAAPRRNGGRSTALVAVACALLFAGAVTYHVSGGSARVGAALSIIYDDEYTPSNPVHPKDDDMSIDDNGAPMDDGTSNRAAQQVSGDNSDTSWADVEVDIDLRQYPYVQEFLEARNVSSISPESVVLDYVPKLKLRYNLKRAAGALGAQALSG